MRATVVDLIFHPGMPIVMSILFEDGHYERHNISIRCLGNLARQSVHAMSSMNEQTAPIPHKEPT